MIILDTDIVTLMHAEHPAIIRQLQISKDEDIVTTVVTLVESMRGRYDFLMKADSKAQFLHAQKLLQTEIQNFAEMHMVLLDEAALDHFEELRTKKGLRKIGRADLLIASIALARRATLVTRNLKHFKLIPQLKLANWVN